MPTKLEIILSQLNDSTNPAQRLQLLDELIELYADIDFLKAFEAAEEMYQLAQKHKFDQFVAHALSQKAWLHIGFGNVQESFTFITQARLIYTQLEDEKGLARTSLHASAVLRRLGDYPGALEEALTALNLYQTHQDHLGVADALARLSYLYVHLGDYEQAEKFSLKAYSEFEAIRSLDVYKFSIPNSLAMAYFHQKKYTEALDIYTNEVDFLREKNIKSELATALNNLGTVLMELDQLDDAETLVTEALQLNMETNLRYGELNTLFTLGEIEEKRKNYEKAIDYFSQSLEKATANQIGHIIYELHDRLATVYENLGQTELAFTHLKKYRETREPLFKAESLNRMRDLQFIHETKQAMDESRRNAEIVLQRNREIDLLKMTLTLMPTISERRQVLDIVCMELLSVLKSTISFAAVLSDDQNQAVIEAGFRGDQKINLIDFNIGDLIPRDATLVVRLLDEQKVEAVDDASDYFNNTGLAGILKELNVASLLFLPIVIQKRTAIILVAGFDSLRVFKDADINLATALVASLSQIFENAQLYRDLLSAHETLSKAYDATIEGWAKILELHDLEAEGHARRVTEETVKLAKAFGLSDGEVVHIQRGALLHDIGKLGVPDQIVLKPGSLTDEEWAVMRKHPQYAYEMLASIEYLKPALDIPYCHHEKWDGSGYPQGLKGDQIPLAARLFAVVDVWDALRSDRPYRQMWSNTEVYEYIQSLSGKQFDPKVVDVFFAMLGH